MAHLTSFVHYCIVKWPFNERCCVLSNQDPCDCSNNVHKLYLCGTFNSQNAAQSALQKTVKKVK